MAQTDKRIRIVDPAGRPGLDAALAEAAGEFCLPLAAHDHLSPHALLLIAGEIQKDPDAAWIYWDHDIEDAAGYRHTPQLCCPPNFDLELSSGYMSEHACWRMRHVRDAGGFGDDAAGAAVFRLGLALLDWTDRRSVRHIPQILTHRGRLTDPNRGTRRLRILSEHSRSQFPGARAELLDDLATCRIRYPLPVQPPRVSIIIATRDRLDLLRHCIESLIHRTTYPDYEILVIDNGSSEPDMLEFLESASASGRMRVLRDEFVQLVGVEQSRAREAEGEILCLLNNDTEVRSPDWLEEMVSHVLRTEVGIVGAALSYPDGSVQHAGVVIDWVAGRTRCLPFHAFKQRGWSHPRHRSVQNFGAVTGACIVLRRQTFEAVGGLRARHLPVGFNDVDLCLRITEELDLRVVWTPFARLMHKQSASREMDSDETRIARARERSNFSARWFDAALDDPAASPDAYGEDTPPLGALPRGTLRATFRRLRSPRLAFVHIPKTAGVTLQVTLNHEYPGHGLLILSARRGDDEKLLELPDVAPGDDVSMLQRAQEVLAGFGFVGRQEALQEHLALLGGALGWSERLVGRLNEGTQRLSPPAREALSAIREYNRLDQLLYDWVAAMPNGLLLHSELLVGGDHGTPPQASGEARRH